MWLGRAVRLFRLARGWEGVDGVRTGRGRRSRGYVTMTDRLIYFITSCNLCSPLELNSNRVCLP